MDDLLHEAESLIEEEGEEDINICLLFKCLCHMFSYVNFKSFLTYCNFIEQFGEYLLRHY